MAACESRSLRSAIGGDQPGRVGRFGVRQYGVQVRHIITVHNNAGPGLRLRRPHGEEDEGGDDRCECRCGRLTGAYLPSAGGANICARVSSKGVDVRQPGPPGGRCSEARRQELGAEAEGVHVTVRLGVHRSRAPLAHVL